MNNKRMNWVMSFFYLDYQDENQIAYCPTDTYDIKFDQFEDGYPMSIECLEYSSGEDKWYVIIGGETFGVDDVDHFFGTVQVFETKEVEYND